MLTQARLLEVVHYDRETGVFTRLVAARNSPVGPIGSINAGGYIRFKVDGITYFAHRVAWLYETGSWPKGDIDHRDTDKTNNKFDNLRQASESQNCANARISRRNTTGFKGVTYVTYGKRLKRYRAQIKKNYHSVPIGYFLTAEEAHAAYCAEADRLFGDFARGG